MSYCTRFAASQQKAENMFNQAVDLPNVFLVNMCVYKNT